VTSQRSLKLSVALFFAVVTASSAFAWTWNNRAVVFNGNGLCVQSTAGIDTWKQGVFSGNIAYADTYALRQGCGAGLTLPDGWAAVRLDLFKWNGSEWLLCRGTNFKYGATGVNQWGPWGPQEVFAYGFGGGNGPPPACGTGWYGTVAYSWAWDGSQWRGGGVYSGPEFAR
jgi:hypothetical protein